MAKKQVKNKLNRKMLVELIEKSDILLSRSGHGSHKKGFEFTMTLQDYDIFHTLSGSYTLIINHRKYLAQARDSFLITPHSTFTLIANEDSEQLYYHFSVVYADRINQDGDFEDYKLPNSLLPIIGQYKKYFMQLSNQSILAQAALKSVFKIVLMEMIFMSDENFQKFIANRNSPFSSRLLNVVRYIQANPGIPLKTFLLAQMAGFNPIYFSRYFKKHLGISVSDYIENVKMNAAKHLLVDKGASVKETAMELGFSDQFIFSKKFKKYFGVSPNQFKKMQI